MSEADGEDDKELQWCGNRQPKGVTATQLRPLLPHTELAVLPDLPFLK